MIAIQVRSEGGPEVLELSELARLMIQAEHRDAFEREIESNEHTEAESQEILEWVAKEGT